MDCFWKIFLLFVISFSFSACYFMPLFCFAFLSLFYFGFCLTFNILSTVFLGGLDLHSMAQQQGLGCSVWDGQFAS